MAKEPEINTTEVAGPLFRIVEDQPNRKSSYDPSDSQEKIDFLERFIDSGKPRYPDTGHHYLIQTPFRYPLPVDIKFAARFKPGGLSRNVFYGAKSQETACFECAYHFMKVRTHLRGYIDNPVSKICFNVDFRDEQCLDISDREKHKDILRPKDYEQSHKIAEKYINKGEGRLDSILYASIRHQEGLNVASFDIGKFNKDPNPEIASLTFRYNPTNQMTTISNNYSRRSLEILWNQVNI